MKAERSPTYKEENLEHLQKLRAGLILEKPINGMPLKSKEQDVFKALQYK
jgi:hypothetical protein